MPAKRRNVSRYRPFEYECGFSNSDLQPLADRDHRGTLPRCRRRSERRFAWSRTMVGSGEIEGRQFKHPAKPGRVTISGKESDDLAPGTFDSILEQAGLKK